MSAARENPAEPEPVWVIDADADLRRQIEIALAGTPFEPLFRSRSDPLPPTGVAGHPDCVILHLEARSSESTSLPTDLRELVPLAALLLVADPGPDSTLAAARRLGAFDLLLRPAVPETLEPAVRRAADFGELRRRNAELERWAAAGCRQSSLLGGSRAIAHLRATIAAIAISDQPVLIVGECGSGKGRAARAVHAASLRRDGPFLKLPCAAVPPGMMVGELFGSERRAAGGAILGVPGFLERARRGSTLLDEISDLSPSLQPRLADALRSGSFHPIGGTRAIRLETRLLSATQKDLDERASAGRFSRELLAAVAGAVIRVPPLRERREDIPVLAASLLAERATAGEPGAFRLTPEAVERLLTHDWPGNVRELRNVLERAVLLSTAAEIGAEHIILDSRLSERARGEGMTGGQTLRERERAWILQVLREAGGNRSAAARRLGVSVRTIRNKLAEYRTDPSFAELEPPGRWRRAG